MAEPPPWVVEGIRKNHRRDLFECGRPSLDDFLRRYARQNEELEVGRTFVATLPGDLRVLGYYTLGAGSLKVESLPEAERRRLPKYPVPVIHLGRLAVDRTIQKQRLGEFLLVHALRKAWAASQVVGAFAVEVMAIDDPARSFYAKYGFLELLDDRLHLYLATKTIGKLFAPP
ncbi:MAG TPA: GNAT family N-acetyltransferase [Planctomycetota bacterium]|nr:GNAT family N-acetyltransferase [Planctomycetota bacterium]